MDAKRSLSVISVSSGDSVSGPPPALSPAIPPVLSVASLQVHDGGTGIHQGNLVNFTVNQYIVPTGSDLDADVVNELMSDAIKINSDTKRQFIDLGTPSSRGWCCRSGLKAITMFVPKRFRKLTGVLVVTAVVVVVVAAVLITVFGFTPSPSDNGIKGCSSLNDSSFCIVTRDEWGAANSTDTLNSLTLPSLRVIVAHTGGSSCTTTTACINIVHAMQTSHQLNGLSDIAYNFLIGGDGKAYEGRGWLLEGAHTRNNNFGSLGVAFVGTYVLVKPSVAMVEAFNSLMNLSLSFDYLASDYDLLGQCQLENTLSPGLALIKNMTVWPHFNTGLSYDYCAEISRVPLF